MGSVKRDISQVPAGGTPARHSATASPRGLVSPFEEMERMFGRMMGRPFSRSWLEPMRFEWPTLSAELPRVDLIDRDQEIVLRAEIPGVAKDDLEITMSGNSVTLRGSTRHEEEKEEGDYHYRETSQGEFYRTIALPTEVDSDKARAKYKDGIVELVLPKLAAAQRKKVEVESE